MHSHIYLLLVMGGKPHNWLQENQSVLRWTNILHPLLLNQTQVQPNQAPPQAPPPPELMFLDSLLREAEVWSRVRGIFLFTADKRSLSDTC